MLQTGRRQHRQHRLDLGAAREQRCASPTAPARPASSTSRSSSAAELGTVGIRANCVAPGPVDTAMAKLVHTVKHPRRLPRHHSAEPLRHARGDRVGRGFLCSPAASYVNGQTLAADGGFEATGVGLPTLRKNAKT
jgi:enoyl-[acyl-carrier-protein] reductase (NADH)